MNREHKEDQPTLLSYQKDWTGVYTLQVRIKEKTYTFCLTSEFFLRKFLKKYNKGFKWRAINFLKKVNRKDIALIGGDNG